MSVYMKMNAELLNLRMEYSGNPSNELLEKIRKLSQRLKDIDESIANRTDGGGNYKSHIK